MGKIAKWRQFSDEQLAQMVKDSKSFYELASKIGYVKSGGGSQAAIKQMVKEKGFDTSHFTGQGWNKDNYNYDLFYNGSVKSNGKSTLKALINLRGHQCECCKLTHWNDQLIPLEVHHIDGDHNNNSLENLQLLCLNCHAQTSNFRGKNINTGRLKVSEEDFVQALKDNNTIAGALRQLKLSLGSGNYCRANELIVKYQISKFLKVEH